MNFYLLQLIGKWINFLFVTIVSLLNFNDKNALIVYNEHENFSVLTEIIPYETIKYYDSSIPSNISNVLKEGKDGVVYKDSDGNSIVLEDVVNEELVIGTGKYGIYSGIITGYGPDCHTCNGEGYVACRTKDRKDFNLITDGIYYQDEEFGSVRVLAAALKEFPCGTIVEVDSKTLGKFTGIVMDTGYDMRRYYEIGIYHFDVAHETEKDKTIMSVTDMSGNVSYSVQRWGW